MAIIARFMKFQFAVLLLTGCVSIPPESITVNEKISAGVVTMEENTNLVIDAWRETAVALLEEKFDAIYDDVEERYRSKRGIPSVSVGGPDLNADQARDVAVFVMLVNERVRGAIDEKAANMRLVSQQNAGTIKGANDSITNLLQSSQAVISGREATIKDVTDLLPIPADVTGIIDSAKNVANDAL